MALLLPRVDELRPELGIEDEADASRLRSAAPCGPGPVAIGSFLHKGTRTEQEDGVILQRDFSDFLRRVGTNNISTLGKVDLRVPRVVLAVLDGHAGDSCMTFVKSRLVLQLALEFMKSPGNWTDAIARTITALERKWMDKVRSRHPKSRSGTSLTLVVLEGKRVFCGWVGDSPCWVQLACGKVVPVTTRLHRPTDRLEQERISRAGGEVRQREIKVAGMLCLPAMRRLAPPRVHPGGLNMSRTIGDARYKLSSPGVLVAEPEVSTVEIGTDACFLIVCSDGLADNLQRGYAQLHKALRKGFDEGYYAVKEGRIDVRAKQKRMDVVTDVAAECAVGYALKKRSGAQDNTSAVVVAFLRNLHSYRNLDTRSGRGAASAPLVA